MEYTITVPSSEIAIPLLLVASAMATHKATLGGTVTYHKPTYKTVNKYLCTDLLNEIRQNRLQICNQNGFEIQVGNDSAELHEYFSTLEQLNDWGNGTHVFSRIDMQLYESVADLTDCDGKVIEAGYYRGYDGYATTTPKEDVPPDTTPSKVKAASISQDSKSNALQSHGLDWKVEARKLADEFFDSDTKLNCRRTLDGYATLVMDKMQELEIHSPRGRITNSNTVKRDALSGDKWWRKKAK